MNKVPLFLIFMFPSAAFALQPLDDSTMSSVTGQDGLSINLASDNAGISATELRVALDEGGADEGIISLGDISFIGVDIPTGITGGSPVVFQTDLDVGSDASNTPYLSVDFQLKTPTRLRVGALSLGGTNAFGSAAIEAASGGITLVNQGLFSMTPGSAYLLGEINDSSLFYRWSTTAGDPYLILDNFDLRWEMPKGTLGITDAAISNTNPNFAESNSYGIFMASGDRVFKPGTALAESYIDVLLDFDLKYRDPPGASPEFLGKDVNAAPMVHFGWKGALTDARLIWGRGGSWDAAGRWDDQSTLTSGLRLEAHWNYMTNAEAASLGDSEKEFRWRLSEAGGSQTGIELSDWQNLPGADYAFDFPFLAIDMIPAGRGPGGVGGGLCWGGADNGGTGACAGAGSLVRLTPGAVRSSGLNATTYDALGLLVRDGNQLAYSNQIKIMDGTTVAQTMDWGLIYTFANIDGNIFAYPGGNPSKTTEGLMVDLLLMSQSLDGAGNQNWNWNHATHWDKGTHFMIADTAACAPAGPISCASGEEGMGLGLIGSSLMLAFNDMRIYMKSGSGYDAGIDLYSPQSRIALKGTFGGGTIPDGSTLVRGMLVDVNLEGQLNIRLSPDAPDCGDTNSCGLNYSTAARLGSFTEADGDLIKSGEGSYLKLAELNGPDMAYTLGDITGDFAWVNGSIDLQSDDETGVANKPAMEFSHDILFGATAKDRLVDGGLIANTDPAQPFIINDASLGDNRMGAVAIPSGQWGLSLTLRPQ